MAPGRKGLKSDPILASNQPLESGGQVRLHTSAAAQDQDENSILFAVSKTSRLSAQGLNRNLNRRRRH
jgi:hypothetical protein